MKELLTATGVRKLNLYLAENNDIKVMHDDISYQEELFNQLAILEPDVLLICDKLPGVMSKRELVNEIVKLKKKMKIIIILKDTEDITFIRELKSLGINAIFDMNNTNVDEDLVPAILFEDPEKEEVKEIVKQIEEEKTIAVDAEKSEKIYIKKEMIAIVSPGGGGVGKSTISVNLGMQAAVKYKNAKIIIADFNEEKPDVARYLNMPDEKGLVELSKSIKEDNFNEESILKSIEQHSLKYPNLYILSGVRSLLDSDLYSLSYYRYILDVLKDRFDLVIIDTGSFKADSTHAAIEKSSKVLFIVRDTESCLDSLNQKIKLYENDLSMEIKSKMEIFMNMTVGVEDLNEDGVKEIFAKEPIANIPLNTKIIFDTEKYSPFVLNTSKYKREIKNIDEALDALFKYHIEEQGSWFRRAFDRR